MTMLDTGCASGGTTVPGFVLGFALLPLALGIVTFGRDQPVFRSGTTLVEVSAIVTRDGVPVADLRRSEVRVLDEDVEQPLVAFEYVDLTNVDGPEQRRDFVLVIDDWHIDARRTLPTRRLAEQVIDALGPHDRLAIFNTGPHEVLQPLSTDREASRRLLRRVHGQSGTGPPLADERELRAQVALARIRNNLSTLAADTWGRRTVIVVSEGHPGLGEAPGIREPLAWRLVREQYRLVLEAAAFLNVAIYGIDPRGLTSDALTMAAGGNASAAAVASRTAEASADSMLGRYYGTLGLLAMHTGGSLTVDTNDLARDIPRIIRESRQYYRLAYAQPEIADGTQQPATRRIEVEVDRQGVEVRARQRYVPRRVSDSPD